MKTTLSWSFLFLMCFLVSASTAAEYVEDFEYANPAGMTFSSTNGIFNHSITTLSQTSDGFDVDDSFIANNNTLNLYPAIDDITFSLGAGETVEWVSFDYFDGAPGNTHVYIFGTESNYTFDPSIYTTWLNWDSRTASLPSSLGEITSIELYSYEAGFDNITIGVVPEPVSLSLLALGGVVLFRRKREL